MSGSRQLSINLAQLSLCFHRNSLAKSAKVGQEAHSEGRLRRQLTNLLASRITARQGEGVDRKLSHSCKFMPDGGVLCFNGKVILCVCYFGIKAHQKALALDVCKSKLHIRDGLAVT